MNKRMYNTDPEILLEQGKVIMSSSNESKFHFKVFVVNMVLSGFPASQICSVAGVSKVAVTSWVKTVDEEGFDALKSKEHKGRPNKLSSKQLKEIDIVLQSNPKEYGFKNWDGPSLSSYIKNKYEIELSVRQCQRLFHNLGFSLIRPQSYPSKGYEDTNKLNEFKKTHRSRKRQ